MDTNLPKIFIPVLLGTNRQGRQSEYVANLLLDKLKRHASIETELIDIRNIVLPADGYGQDIKEQFGDYRDVITRADGLVIVTPEYNHGYPGTLKSALDLLFSEYKHKAVGLVGVSSGPWGGTRVIENLIPVVRTLGLIPTSLDLQFSEVGRKFDSEGALKDDKYHKRIDDFIKELKWMAAVLRWGRTHL
jgi:NAD(P)H-dependent FMN reductase